MSTVKICDICGKRIGTAKANYRLEFLVNDPPCKESLDICENCIKTIKKLSLKEEKEGEDSK